MRTNRLEFKEKIEKVEETFFEEVVVVVGEEFEVVVVEEVVVATLGVYKGQVLSVETYFENNDENTNT